MTEVMEAGVAIEINPSSNLVTGAVDRFADHPYFRFEEALGDLNVTTVNTDDPGVFGTRLDVEYALVFEAMLERGMPRSRALDVLERMRRMGIDRAFWSHLDTPERSVGGK